MEEATAMTKSGKQVYIELWVSLASLLRSYTAAHGLNGDRQATVELGEERITVRNITSSHYFVRCAVVSQFVLC